MKICKSIYQKKNCLLPFSISALISGLLFILFVSACGGVSKHHSTHIPAGHNPSSQSFRDATALLPIETLSIGQANFLLADKDSASDLAILNKSKLKLYILLNQGGKGFLKIPTGQWTQNNKEKINFFAVADLNSDGGDDLILILGDSENPKTQILFNNKKGYFYSKEGGVYSLRLGIKKVIPVDLDGDGDRDLFYLGNMIKPPAKKHHQTMVLINKGDGSFENLTSLLMPPLPAGIRDASFADYNGDRVVDIFLVYGKGQNRLLINNGVGKFSDRTSSSIPRILDDSMHADWADFDQDGDNDILVVNRSIHKKYRRYSGETNYFLENKGGGIFRKRSHKILPRFPSQKVYLLDGNGNNHPDALILTTKGVYYLQGYGKWQFSDETIRRLPRFKKFDQMIFGDINQDKFLDLLGWSRQECSLWLNRFD